MADENMSITLLTEETVKSLSKEKKNELVHVFEGQLRLLNLIPRSDWHEGFEALLRLDAREAEGGCVEVETEHRLGIGSPRVDFIVWLQDEGTRLNKEIYRIFRRFNIIEYKNPKDSLNWQVIHKAIGYANLYFGLSEGNRCTKDEITVSIFRAVKNPMLFKELKETGHLVEDQTKGIYHVFGLTEFPFQIIIMTELVGDEYAAARALIDNDRANLEDIQRIVDSSNNEKDESRKNYWRVILNLISVKNPNKTEELGRRRKMISPVLMNIMKPDLDERDIERDKENAYNYVQAGGMTLEFAASQFHQSAESFGAEMTRKGYTVPSQHVAVSH